MDSDIKTAHEDAIRVVKKQRTSEESTAHSFNTLILQIHSALERLRDGQVHNVKSELQQLKTSIESEGLLKTMNKDTRDFHDSIKKLGKVMEEYFLKDISLSTRDVKLDSKALERVLLEHLFKEGRFDLSDVFAKEAQLTDASGLKESYMKLHSIVQDLKRRNLDSALQWAQENRSQISKTERPSRFEFQLHHLRYLTILKTSGQAEALAYCKAHFPQFSQDYFPEIQRLTCLLVYVKHPASLSPYPDEYEEKWSQIIHDFIKQACEILGQAQQSPLLVAVSAGSVVLPQLIRMADAMASSGQDIKQCVELPLEVELGREFQFHSVFACPVAKEQSTIENPPMMMPCGHVLCEHSISKIVKQKNKPFKCPYCPLEALPNCCRKLTFPDIIP